MPIKTTFKGHDNGRGDDPHGITWSQELIKDHPDQARAFMAQARGVDRAGYEPMPNANLGETPGAFAKETQAIMRATKKKGKDTA